MKELKIIVALAFVIIFINNSCQKKKANVPIAPIDCSNVTYSNQIYSLIQKKCIECHGPESTDGKMTNYNQIQVYAKNGKYKARLLDIQDMPISEPLTSEELGQMRCWIEAGAPEN